MLCELCTILQALIALDPSGAADTEDQDDRDEEGDTMSFITPLSPPESHTGNSFFPAISTSTPTKSRPFGQAQQQHWQVAQQRHLGELRFSILLQGLLQDAQTRLVFRAQAIIQSDVAHYSPSDEDLDYPAKLKGNRRMSLWIAAEEEEGDHEGPSLRLPDMEVQETWYPTLRKTLWVLTRLHTYVKVSRKSFLVLESCLLLSFSTGCHLRGSCWRSSDGMSPKPGDSFPTPR